jgi:hypothetical protein
MAGTTVLCFTLSIAIILRASLFDPGGLAQPRRRRRSGEAEMVAQYLAVVVAAQEGRGGGVSAFRHDQVDNNML